MNANTLKSITRHGQALLRAFPNSTEKNPVALCKKLRRIETSLTAPLLRNCNEGMPEGELDAICEKAIARTAKLLGIRRVSISPNPENEPLFGFRMFINRDPRGYALKIDDEWVRAYNNRQYKLTQNGLPLYTDMGGYGILAPDLTADK